MYLLFGLYFVIGIVIGSFLNVCIYRLPLGKSVISPPSACGSCGHRLGALDMIPVLSYFLLRGRCRYCNAAYSARYMLVELLTGILFALCGLYYLPGLKIILVFFFVACLIVQAFIDLDHQILLDEILMLMLPTGIIYAYYALPDMWDSLYGALFAGGLMLLIFLLSRGGMGAGDVKLSFVLGVWLGFKASIVCLMLAFVFDMATIERWAEENDLNDHYKCQLDNGALGEFLYQEISLYGRAKFYLLHTFSHVLMKELEFTCGYPTASLSERLYYSDKMCGVLIYTADGAEGSMGGLVWQGQPRLISSIIESAMKRAGNCSSDPLCWENEDSLNRASCFGCTMVSETSCEYQNMGLDRRALVDEEYGFFKNLVGLDSI